MKESEKEGCKRLKREGKSKKMRNEIGILIGIETAFL